MLLTSWFSARCTPFSSTSDSNDSALSSLESDDVDSNGDSDQNKRAHKPSKTTKATITPCHCLSTVSRNWQAKVANAKLISMTKVMQLLLESQGTGVCYRHLHALGGKLGLKTNKLNASKLQAMLNDVYDRRGDIWDLKTNSAT